MTTKIPVELSSTPSIVDGGNATAITIDSSERIGIGTSSPDYKLVTRDATTSNYISVIGATNGNAGIAFGDDDAKLDGGILFKNDTKDLRFFKGGFTEAMRIASSGEVLIGTTGSGAAGALYINTSASNSSVGAVRLQTSDYQGSSDLSTTAISVVKSSNNTTTSQTFIRFGINSFSAGSGQINANGASQCAFGTFSDRTLKENITDLPTQLDKIKTLRPVEFDYIESQGGGHQLGFIAQEVEEIYPDMVGETEGKKTLAGLGKWEARLIKAIQEQQAIIEDLQTQINEVKNGN